MTKYFADDGRPSSVDMNKAKVTIVFALMLAFAGAVAFVPTANASANNECGANFSLEKRIAIRDSSTAQVGEVRVFWNKTEHKTCAVTWRTADAYQTTGGYTAAVLTDNSGKVVTAEQAASNSSSGPAYVSTECVLVAATVSATTASTGAPALSITDRPVGC